MTGRVCACGGETWEFAGPEQAYRNIAASNDKAALTTLTCLTVLDKMGKFWSFIIGLFNKEHE
jgi:hypothetical protein